MKTLAQYLADTGVTATEFARRAKLNNGLVFRYLSGELTPKLENAQAIADATGGEVPVDSWLKPRRARRTTTTRSQN